MHRENRKAQKQVPPTRLDWVRGTLSSACLIIASSGLLAATPASARPTKLQLSAQLAEARRAFARSGVVPTIAGDVTNARQVTAGTIAEFLPFIQEDLDANELGRAAHELGAVYLLLSRLKATANIPASNFLLNPRLSTPSTQGRWWSIQGGSLVFTPPNGQPRPAFLTGYGLLDEWREQVERVASVGANVIQLEIGPDKLFPAPDVVDTRPLEHLRGIMDRAANVGVAVDVLLSPHYFPEWLLRQEPQLRRHRSGFVQYCIHHPSGRALLRRFVQLVVDSIKDHPALLSVCLANEPQNVEEPCATATNAWHAWLQNRHGSLKELNSAHRADYEAYEDVRLPDPYAPRRARGVWLDFVRFNQEEHAAWLKLLADAVHASAPELPVHVKALAPWFSGRSLRPEVGLEPTLLAAVGDFNGNDGANSYAGYMGEFAQNWLENAMGHDLQRSVKFAPVFNSENHLINDREARSIPPAHVRSALWQAAVHGQSVSTIWLWARSVNRSSDSWGSILERPSAVDAVGRVNLDMNRVAPELTALQQAPVDVAILHGSSPQVWEPGFLKVVDALYVALSFTGRKIGFVTERQLEEGIDPAVPVLFVPGIVHLSSRALQQLSGYRGRLVFVGRRDLRFRDEYDRPSPIQLQADTIGVSSSSSWRALWAELVPVLGRWVSEPAVTIRSPRGDPIWGVEWRTAPASADSWLVNLVNYRKEAVTVALSRNGSKGVATDVLTGARAPRVLAMEPLETRLLRVH